MLIFGKIMSYLRRLDRFFYRIRLKDKSFSLITNNCLGGVILHDLHLQFKSPTINVGFSNEQFVLFCEHLEHYCSLPLQEAEWKHPMGVIHGDYGDVFISFRHYSSFEEARIKWEDRVQRLDFHNLFIIMEAKDGCPDELLLRFDRLPYRKVVLTDGKHPDVACSFPMKKGFYSKNYWNGKVLEYPLLGARRYLNIFDYVTFFNTGKIRRRYV